MKLKPCPFCGEKWSSPLTVEEVDINGVSIVVVRCGFCGALGPEVGNGANNAQENAITAWNNRAE